MGEDSKALFRQMGQALGEHVMKEREAPKFGALVLNTEERDALRVILHDYAHEYEGRKEREALERIDDMLGDMRLKPLGTGYDGAS